MTSQKDIDEMYMVNSQTVREIGSRFGFKLHSFNPDWCIYHGAHGGVKEVDNKFMECVARMMNLPWTNIYNSSLSTVVLDRASEQMGQEDQVYRIALMAYYQIEAMAINPKYYEKLFEKAYKEDCYY